MTEKLFYMLFKVSREGVSTKYTDKRKYIGKEISPFPKTTYLGENECPSLKKALRRLGHGRFTKVVLKYCESEEELNAEYDKIVTPKFCNNKEHVYNRLEPPKTGKYKRTKAIKKKNSKSKIGKSEHIFKKLNIDPVLYNEMYDIGKIKILDSDNN